MQAYVYKLTHKTSDQYYFGFRCANKVSPVEDLGIRYFTSSDTIKEIGFENFYYCIVKEFFDKHEAFDFESLLIAEHIHDKNCLNKSLNGKLCPIRKFTTLEHRQNLSKALAGKKRKRNEGQTERQRIRIANMSEQERKDKFGSGGKAAQKTISQMTIEERSEKFGTMKNKTHSEEAIEKIKAGNRGKIITDEAKLKMSARKLGIKQKPEVVLERAKRHVGGGNPRAIPITIAGVCYSCKKEAYEALGWSKKKLERFLALERPADTFPVK